jgi:hypothetical protein
VLDGALCTLPGSPRANVRFNECATASGEHRYLDFLKKHDFNAIRLLFNHDNVERDDIVETPEAEELLFQTRYINMFRMLAKEAGRRGILIMIACHRITADAWPGAGLWYDDSIGWSEERVMKSWTKLAPILCEHWNIFAADITNEVNLSHCDPPIHLPLPLTQGLLRAGSPTQAPGRRTPKRTGTWRQLVSVIMSSISALAGSS